MDPQWQETFPRLLEKAKTILKASPACHDWDHTVRVLNNARSLAAVERADAAVVDYAAILHDVGRPDELADTGRTCHAERGAQIALELLPQIGVVDKAFINHVASCIRTHRYRSRTGRAPASIEARVIFDADKLDCIGAVGVGRAFHFAGRIGACLHNSMEQALAGESYGEADSAYREYLVKLRYIRDAMLTAEGKHMAEGRHAFMTAFFERICRESHGEDFAPARTP